MTQSQKQRTLIVNADDLGLTPGINRGILHAHAYGIVTSASLMVRAPAAEEAAAMSRNYPNLGIGLHLDLSEWIFKNDKWVCLYEVVPLNDCAAVAAEVDRQLAAFVRIMGREPTHIDSHQHFHKDQPLRRIVKEAVMARGIRARHFSSKIQYCGLFYGADEKGRENSQAIQVDALVQILRELPPGISELCCHPGFAADLDSIYRAQRDIEVATLCDPRVRDTVAQAGIRLANFHDFRNAHVIARSSRPPPVI